MKNFFKSLLTENKEHISVGSFCIFSMSMIYSVLLVFAFIFDKKLPLDGYEFATIVGALYGVKKFSQVLNGKKKGKSHEECLD